MSHNILKFYLDEIATKFQRSKKIDSVINLTNFFDFYDRSKGHIKDWQHPEGLASEGHSYKAPKTGFR